MPMFASFEWSDFIARSPYLNAVWIAGVALLMVSTIPTVSLKRLHMPHHLFMPTMLGIVVLVALATTVPWPTLTCVGLVYIGSIPLTVQAYHRRRQAAAASEPKSEAAVSPALTAPPAGASYPLGEGNAPTSEWRH